MHDRQSAETILARLMPPALSTGGQMEIAQMLDELAGTPESTRRSCPWVIPAAGIAATLAAILAATQFLHNDTPRVLHASAGDPSAAFTLVSESGRVEDMVDEGWSDTPDGSAMRRLRLRVIEESRLLDQTTGIVMNISQPREEILLMPVSTF